MPSTRIPEQVSCGQLMRGDETIPGGRRQPYKNGLKQNLKTCGISPNELNSAPLARALWRSRCQDAIDDFEATRVGAYTDEAASSENYHNPDDRTVDM